MTISEQISFNAKMKRGSFTIDDLNSIADAAYCPKTAFCRKVTT